MRKRAGRWQIRKPALTARCVIAPDGGGPGLWSYIVRRIRPMKKARATAAFVSFRRHCRGTFVQQALDACAGTKFRDAPTNSCLFRARFGEMGGEAAKQ